jgi:hypothetical protein
MTSAQRRALREIGITMESYYVSEYVPPMVCPNGHAMDEGLFECPACGVHRPSGWAGDWIGPTWGTAFVKDGRDLFVVEHHAHGALRNKYILRDARTKEGERPEGGEYYKLQRLAVADAIRRQYHL